MRQHLVRLALAVLSLPALSLAGCVDQSPITPSADTIIIEGVLDAGSRDQYVIVRSTTGATSSATDIAGAIVTLGTPGGALWRADEEHDTVTTKTSGVTRVRVSIRYHISLDRLGATLVPGGTYTLRVAAPDGRVVSGATTLPNAIVDSDSGTASSFDKARDTVSLTWPRVQSARGYEVLVHSPVVDFSTFTDTSVVLTGATQSSGGVVAFSRGYTNQVVVSAVDANYYDYYRRGTDPFTGTGAIIHLDGGVGLFGSIVEIRRLSFVVK
jgi:hypothetical protein